MGTPIGDNKLFTSHFVDDQAFKAEDRSDIDYMLIKLQEAYEAQYRAVGDQGENLNLGPFGEYSGLILTAKGGSSDEISNRMTQARVATRQLNGIFGVNK